MEIRYAVDTMEGAGALRLVYDAYVSRGYIKELLPPFGESAQVLVAVHEGTVIGTVSIVPGFAGPLPTQKYFGLTPPDRPGTTMEIGRLAVAACAGPARGMAIIGLLAAVQLWGDKNGIKLALATLRPALPRRLAMLGVICEPLAEPEEVVIEEIPPEFEGYFFPQSAVQRPVAVLIRLDQARAPILGHLSGANGDITISPKIAPWLARSTREGRPPPPLPPSAAALSSNSWRSQLTTTSSSPARHL